MAGTGFKLEYNAISKSLGHFVSRAKKKDIEVGIFQSMTCDLHILTCRTGNSAFKKPSVTVWFSLYCFLGIKKWANQTLALFIIL